MQAIDKLDYDKATLRVLLFLYKEERAKITSIIRGVPVGQRAAYTALSTLVGLKLVEEQVSEGFPFTRNFILTEKGQKVSEKLAEIQAILET